MNILEKLEQLEDACIHFISTIESQQQCNVPSGGIPIRPKHPEMDNRLGECTPLTVHSVTLLLEKCLKATFLQFQPQYYWQILETAIELPVLVTVTNLVMEDIEQRALSTFMSTESLFWKRYVDDTCVTLKPQLVEEFHQHLNSKERSSVRCRRITNFTFLIST